MIVFQQKRGDALGATDVIGVGAEAHRPNAVARTRMSGFAGGWYGTALPVATPAIRPSGAESRS